jgi:hypothetical protein
MAHKKMKNISKINLVLIGIVLIAPSLSCKLFTSADSKTTAAGPSVDFTTPGKSLDVKVQLDKKHSASGKISPGGGSVSLASADGSKFTLEVPANALETETEITMTAVKTIDGAPLDKNTPTAVQLEPSGLFFKEVVTLTIIPAKEIPIKEQIIFGYEGEGKDYHLAMIDPKSRDVKIRLTEFSGAGVGSGTDVAWAANLSLQASTTFTQLQHRAGLITAQERMRELLGDESGAEGWAAEMESLFEQYYEKVLPKELAAAELDCRYAKRAIQSMLGAERQKALMGYEIKNWDKTYEQMNKLAEIGSKCKKPAAFQIVGGLDDWQTSTKVCDILQPFKLTAGGFVMNLSGGMAGTYTYTGPYNSQGSGTYKISLPDGLDKPGTMIGTGEGSAEGYSNSGTERYTLTPIPPCG